MNVIFLMEYIDAAIWGKHITSARPWLLNISYWSSILLGAMGALMFIFDDPDGHKLIGYLFGFSPFIIVEALLTTNKIWLGAVRGVLSSVFCIITAAICCIGLILVLILIVITIIGGAKSGGNRKHRSSSSSFGGITDTAGHSHDGVFADPDTFHSSTGRTLYRTGPGDSDWE